CLAQEQSARIGTLVHALAEYGQLSLHHPRGHGLRGDGAEGVRGRGEITSSYAAVFVRLSATLGYHPSRKLPKEATGRLHSRGLVSCDVLTEPFVGSSWPWPSAPPWGRIGGSSGGQGAWVPATKKGCRASGRPRKISPGRWSCRARAPPAP